MSIDVDSIESCRGEDQVIQKHLSTIDVGRQCEVSKARELDSRKRG